MEDDGTLPSSFTSFLLFLRPSPLLLSTSFFVSFFYLSFTLLLSLLALRTVSARFITAVT